MHPGHFPKCENKCVTIAHQYVIGWEVKCCFLNWLESILKGMEEQFTISEGKHVSKYNIKPKIR